MGAVGTLSASPEASGRHLLAVGNGIPQVLLTARTNSAGWDPKPPGGLPTSFRTLEGIKVCPPDSRGSLCKLTDAIDELVLQTVSGSMTIGTQHSAIRASVFGWYHRITIKVSQFFGITRGVCTHHKVIRMSC